MIQSLSDSIVLWDNVNNKFLLSTIPHEMSDKFFSSVLTFLVGMENTNSTSM